MPSNSDGPVRMFQRQTLMNIAYRIEPMLSTRNRSIGTTIMA
jgi:hypothetical protein